VGWSVHGLPEPSSFSANDPARCKGHEQCDVYQLLVANVGDQESSASEPLVVSDRLPAGIAPCSEH
jgi:hypothetical protein